jgi:hypothetical protein
MMRENVEWRHDPAHAVIEDLHDIERLYVLNGRMRDLGPFYQHVLTKTQNPEVRCYVYCHLARSEINPVDLDKAIATLQKGLDEDLARLARLIPVVYRSSRVSPTQAGLIECAESVQSPNV